MAKGQKVKAVDSECYAIEEILESRQNSASLWEYLIKWKDCPDSENSWVSMNDLFSKRKPIAEAKVSNWSIRSIEIHILIQNDELRLCLQDKTFIIDFDFFFCLEWGGSSEVVGKTKVTNTNDGKFNTKIQAPTK